MSDRYERLKKEAEALPPVPPGAAHAYAEHAEGWDVTYLGANTPDTDLLHLVRLIRPHVLGLSVAMPFNLARVRRIVTAVRSHEQLSHTRILLGGWTLRGDPSLASLLGADGSARDADEGVALLERWWHEGLATVA